MIILLLKKNVPPLNGRISSHLFSSKVDVFWRKLNLTILKLSNDNVHNWMIAALLHFVLLWPLCIDPSFCQLLSPFIFIFEHPTFIFFLLLMLFKSIVHFQHNYAPANSSVSLHIPNWQEHKQSQRENNWSLFLAHSWMPRGAREK